MQNRAAHTKHKTNRSGDSGELEFGEPKHTIFHRVLAAANSKFGLL